MAINKFNHFNEQMPKKPDYLDYTERQREESKAAKKVFFKQHSKKDYDDWRKKQKAMHDTYNVMVGPNDPRRFK